MTDKNKVSRDGDFKVAIKARMYHGVLYETMQRLKMTQAEMAKYLGISTNLFGQMIRMQRVPKFSLRQSKQIAAKLEELTEMSVSELFPDHVFTAEFLARDKTVQITRDVPNHLLQKVAMVHQLTLPPDEQLMQAEKNEEKRLETALQVLSEREREILNMRFNEGKSLDAIRQKFGVGRQAIYQIQKIALFKLRGKMNTLAAEDDLNPADRKFRQWAAQALGQKTVHSS